MKKSFFLIEVMISVLLISGIILSLFKIKSNNLNFLNKYNTNTLINSSFSIFMLNNMNTYDKNEKQYLKDIINIKNTNIPKYIKDTKIQVKDKKILDKEIKLEDTQINLITYESTYTMPNEFSKKIYTIKLN